MKLELRFGTSSALSSFGSTRKKGVVALVGYAETPVSRGRTEKGEAKLTGEEYFAWALELVLKQSGLQKKDLDGQGVGIVGTLWPHAEIWSAEVLQNLGLNAKLVIRADTGGMSGATLLSQASTAIEGGIVDLFLCIGGDAPLSIPQPGMVRTWRYEVDFLKPFGMMGPNSEFAFIFRRHMHQHGTRAEHTCRIAMEQRENASQNPIAYMKQQPLRREDYMNSRMIADPIRLLDCCLPVNGGSAFIVSSAKKAKEITDKPVYLLGYGEENNFDSTNNLSDMTVMPGIRAAMKRAFKMAGVNQKSVSFFQPYDDYTIAVLMQIEDAGFCAKGGGGKFIESHDLSYDGDFPLNTGGGQLSSGQPGTCGGFVPILESIRQLRGEGAGRQVKGAKIGVATGIGGISYGNNLVHQSVMVFGNEA